MATKQWIGLLAFVLCTIALAGSVFALPMSISEVEVDGTELQQDAVNKLSIERDQSFKVKVTFDAAAEADNVMGYAEIVGYEHADDEPIADRVGPFSIEANTTYTKTFSLSLPADVDEDSYKLRIMFADRNGQEIFQNYNLKIDEKRHSVAIQDVILYPENSVTAGSALLTTVRVRNYGDKDEQDVKVHIEMAALGLSATDIIDELDNEDRKDSEELYMRVPVDTKAGDYEMLVTVEYNDGRDEITQTVVVHVDADEAYQDGQKPATTITVGSTLENVMQGESVIFPVAVTNSGKTDKAYTVTVAGASDWAEVKISPTSTQIVKSGETKQFYLSIGVNADAAEGSHVFTATISTPESQVEQLALTANVTKAKTSIWTMLAKTLGIAVVAVIVILIVLFAYNRMKGDEDSTEPQTYY
ncbi:hypothetical protein HY493_03255 [Candidatus Woesearchaeota archaeon]|nr:hypothetical protein [Candidatus Woesearchaeota archaeon]